jgi:2-polyprenyl-3-methyl-5-hydroxy-6-metoxy-1,4-benzoquinol methylase
MDDYADAWETFWRDTPGRQGEAIWDSRPEQAAELHLAWFSEHFDPALPVLDLGCGNGTQSRFLAARYPRVIGIDLSKTAIAQARAADPAATVDFRVANALDPAAMAELRRELGDTNVYMRGIIHQSRPEDRARVAATVAALVGERGAVFDVEMAAASKPVLQALARDPQGPRPRWPASSATASPPARSPTRTSPPSTGARASAS